MNTTQQLFNTAQTSGAQAVIGVFRCRRGHEVPDQEPILGLAAKYPRDQDVAQDPDVVFFTEFEADSWRDEWSHVANRNASETVAADPARNDGRLRAWVDGRLAFEKTDIRSRTVAKLKIEQVWMNVYHAGTKPSPYDQHLFIDNVVIARKYIGPRRDG